MPKQIENVIADGDAADRLLADEVFQAACNAVEAKAIHAWKNSPPSAAAARENEYYIIQAMQRIRAELNVISGAGKMAAHQRNTEQRQRAMQ